MSKKTYEKYESNSKGSDAEVTVETDSTPKYDPVHKPSHYNYSKYQPKDIIREWELNMNLGSAIKYIVRAGRKDDIVQDLKKAMQFLQFEVDFIEQKRRETGDKNYGNIK